MVLHLAVLALQVLGNCSLVQLLVSSWVLGIHVDLVVLEHYPLWWILIEDKVERDLHAFSRREEGMLPHLVPAQSFLRLVLHRLVEEVEALEGDLNVSWPCPVPFLDLQVEQPE